MSRWISGPAAALRARPALLSWCSFLSLKCGRWIPFGPCVVPVGSSMKFVVVVLGVVAILVFGSVPRLRGEALFCRQSTCLGSLAGRPSGVRLADVDCSSGVTAALGLAGPLDGRAAPCVIGTRCLGSCSSRPSRQSVVPGSGSGRVVVRGLVGARRDAGWRIRLLDAGLLDVVRIPVLVVALWSFGSTAGSRGVPLEASCPGSALLASGGS